MHQQKQKNQLKLKQSRSKSKARRTASNSLELELLNKGYSRVVGIDEAGRGAWAGPLVVGAFVYTLEHKPVKGVQDSKLVAKTKRSGLANKLAANLHKLAIAELDMLNRLGLGKSLHQLIQEIVEEFDTKDTFFIIDGYFGKNFGKNTRQIIDGDYLHYSIAAASLLAKTHRDALMQEYHKEFPVYGFGDNVGYGTASHRLAIAEKGLCPLHRKTFAPIRIKLEQLSLL